MKSSLAQASNTGILCLRRDLMWLLSDDAGAMRHNFFTIPGCDAANWRAWPPPQDFPISSTSFAFKYFEMMSLIMMDTSEVVTPPYIILGVDFGLLW
eukprot:CAMPEP_0185031644 /NCGR_PEP_ID=MMETSP1103-20130426/19229_1 /TAXON_ID=36769 /ORGANISM="Paraphysomonas bandaiensis, Strain Caron Lab Isolate" /LENGTH=96 /DNA_ID=CAMNT_0027567227 /DNA_START=248 /DNA_END=535 /DNA_ORIENTATION=-